MSSTLLQGGKGATSRKTPVEIRERCDRLALDPGPLIYASRMAAKVDSAAVQDGYQLFHHAFFFRRQAIGVSFSAAGSSDRVMDVVRPRWTP
jgi:hypothetical protein